MDVGLCRNGEARAVRLVCSASALLLLRMVWDVCSSSQEGEIVAESKAGVAMKGNIVFLWPSCITTSCSFGCWMHSHVCSAAPPMFACVLGSLLSLLPLHVAVLPAWELERHRGALVLSPNPWTEVRTSGDGLQLVPFLSWGIIVHVPSRKAANIDCL